MTAAEKALMAVYVAHWDRQPAHWQVHPMIRDGEVVWLKPLSGFGTTGDGSDGLMTDDELKLHIRMLKWLRSEIEDEAADVKLGFNRAH